MKKNLFKLLMVVSVAMTTALVGCKKEEPIIPLQVSQNDGAELKEEIRATSAVFTLTTNGIEEIAYFVEEDAIDVSTLDAAVVYSQAKNEGRILAVQDGANTLPVYALEGNTTYTLVMVYSLGGEYHIKDHVFTTTAYERLITIIETRPDGFTFHFEVPDSACYRYAFTRADMYTSMHTMWGTSDVDNLNDGKVLKGPQTITINDGDYWAENPDLEWDTPWSIKPGTPWIVLMAECDAEGNLLCELPDYGGDDWGGGWWSPATRAGSIWENNLSDYFTMPLESEVATFNGFYARQYMLAGQQLVDNEIEVTATSTERRVKLTCVADETLQYIVAPFTFSDYDYWQVLFTEKGMPSAILENYGGDGEYEGTNEIESNPSYFPVEVDSTYIFAIVGIYNEEASIVSYDTIHVTINKSDKPAAVATITGIEDPDGNPNFVWFNVKSEEQNVKSAMYLMNYTKEFAPMLSYGYSDAELMNNYGQELTAEDVAAINSAEGFNISFTSYEDLESTLWIAAFNEDESMTIYKGTSRSGVRPALDPVNSTLFEDLAGEWEMMVISNIEEFDYETWESYIVTDTAYHTIRMGGSINNGPETFDASNEAYEDVYQNYVSQAIMNGATEEEAAEYAKNNIAALFAEYKEMVVKYENYYKGQNYIVGHANFGSDYHEYAGPWDLFTSLSYSSYDVEELFYDYGPKLFFQVQPDESVVLLSDANCLTVAPVSNWSYSSYVMIGNNPDNYSDMYFGNFPVEISDDKSKVVIKGVEHNGATCYPSLGYVYSGWANLSFQSIADIVLTRAEGSVETASATRATAVSSEKINAARGNGRYMRTALPKSADCVIPAPNKVEMVYVDMTKAHQDAVKAMKEQYNR